MSLFGIFCWLKGFCHRTGSVSCFFFSCICSCFFFCCCFFFGGVLYVVTLLFGFFCGCRGFCHRTESDLLLFLLLLILVSSADFLMLYRTLYHDFLDLISHIAWNLCILLVGLHLNYNNITDYSPQLPTPLYILTWIQRKKLFLVYFDFLITSNNIFVTLL